MFKPTWRPSPRVAHLLSMLWLAVFTVGVWARPVLGGFGHLRLSNPGDSNAFEFYLAWNVHALVNGQDPFYTHVMYAPEGLDLGNAISIPGPSLLVAPVTLLFGGTAGYNVAFLLPIVLAAVATISWPSSSERTGSARSWPAAWSSWRRTSQAMGSVT